MLTCKVIKQIILPTRNRKGNILSSILLLFVSVVDLFINFSWGFTFDFITRWKHYERTARLVRKSVFLTGCLLFLLSSFEWSYNLSNQPSALRETGTITQIEQQTVKSTSRFTKIHISIATIHISVKYVSVDSPEYLYNRTEIPLITSRIYLQNCNFRV